ncbi:hypothetical protein [Sphingomonas aurantiaca]
MNAKLEASEAKWLEASEALEGVAAELPSVILTNVGIQSNGRRCL